MIIYSKDCLACTNKPLWKRVKEFARKHRLFIEVRRTSRPEWRKEADKYEVQLPFVVHEGIALNLNEDLERLLK